MYLINSPYALAEGLGVIREMNGGGGRRAIVPSIPEIPESRVRRTFEDRTAYSTAGTPSRRTLPITKMVSQTVPAVLPSVGPTRLFVRRPPAVPETVEPITKRPYRRLVKIEQAGLFPRFVQPPPGVAVGVVTPEVNAPIPTALTLPAPKPLISTPADRPAGDMPFIETAPSTPIVTVGPEAPVFAGMSIGMIAVLGIGAYILYETFKPKRGRR